MHVCACACVSVFCMRAPDLRLEQSVETKTHFTCVLVTLCFDLLWSNGERVIRSEPTLRS